MKRKVLRTPSISDFASFRGNPSARTALAFIALYALPLRAVGWAEVAKAASLTGYNDAPVASSLTFDSFIKLLAEEKPASASDTVLAIARRYPDYAKNVAYVSTSRSLQRTNPVRPRGVLYGENASLLISFAHPDNGGRALEVLWFDPEASRYRSAEIRYSDEGVEVAREPDACVACHGKNTAPLWESHDVFPGVYGSLDDTLEAEALPADVAPALREHVMEERRLFDTFQDFARTDALYSAVPHPYVSRPSAVFPSDVVRPEPRRPNQSLVRFFNVWNMRTLAARLKEKNPPAELRFALGASLVCGDPALRAFGLEDTLEGFYGFKADAYFANLERTGEDLGVRVKYSFLGKDLGGVGWGEGEFPREVPGRVRVDLSAQMGTFNALLGLVGEDVRRYALSFNPWGGRTVSPVVGVRHFFQSLELGRVFLDDGVMPDGLGAQWNGVLNAHAVVDAYFASAAGASSPVSAIPEYRAAALATTRGWCASARSHVARMLPAQVWTTPALAPVVFDAPRPPLQKCFSCHGDVYRAAHAATPAHPVSAWVNTAAAYAPDIAFHDTESLIRYLTASPRNLERALARVDPKSPGYDFARRMPPAPMEPLDAQEAQSLRVVFRTLAGRRPMPLPEPTPP